MRLFSLLDIQYNNFISNVSNYISKTLSKNNVSFGSNTIFGQIINVVGNAIQNVMLYIEDALVEQNKYTAQRKKSIYGLAALSGYEPSLGKAAIASIKLSFMPHNLTSYKIILKNHETLTCTQNGLKYNIILPQEAVVLSSESTQLKQFSVVQGLFETQKFISTGGQYYTINLKYIGNIDTDYITVKVNNEIWEYAASLYDMSADGKQYTIKNNIAGGIDIIFGNEAHGRALAANDVVTVDYLIHDGEAGNINSDIETYFVFDNDLSDINGDTYDGNALFNITFADTDPVTSGCNSETLEHVKHMIGLNSRSLVLASPENYKVLLSKFGFCGYNRTWSDPNSMTINSLVIKNFRNNTATGIDYFNLTEEDFILSDSQKASVESFIRNSGGQLASSKYSIFNPILCKYAMYLYIKLKPKSYNKELLENQIRAKVGEFFIDIQSDMYIPKSDIIYKLKSEIDDIDSVDVYILSQRNEDALINEQYTEDIFTINPVTGQYIKTTENVKLYPGENPNLGLDTHGNIYLESDIHFPVLMGGWDYKNSENTLVRITDPLSIIFTE
jgi:hypothetical protein